MNKYKTQLRYASDADDKATMYLRWAADALKKYRLSNSIPKSIFCTNSSNQ